MKRVACVILSAAAALASPAIAAAAGHADAICPRAVEKLNGFDTAVASNDVGKIGVAARATVDAYGFCASEAQSARGVEPAMHYDQTRQAQFMVVLGRSLAQQGKTAEATTELREARRLAEEVATWTPSATNYASSNGLGGTSVGRNVNRQGSQYREASVAIRDAADAELKKLGAPSPAPAAATSPAAAASAKPSP